jgi:hypothetical protein
MKLITINKKVRRGLLRGLIREQRGQLLVEALVALAILGIVMVAFLTSLTTTSVAIILADEKTTAESLTRTEIESIKDSPYPAISYQKTIDSYVLDVDAEFISPLTHLPSGSSDFGIQSITIVVEHQDKTVLTTTAYNTRG